MDPLASPTAEPWYRSPQLLDRRCSGLLVIDVQEKLFPKIADPARLHHNLLRLIEGAQILGVARVVTEQYPHGLGATVESLRSGLDRPHEKRMFSCRECAAPLDGWLDAGLRQAVLCGIEAHVCVLQTCLDLLARGFDTYVVADAVGSRQGFDASIALRRMEQAGATLATTESVLFEWCESSAAAEFKEISRLVRELPPA